MRYRYSRFNLQEQLNAKWARDSGDQTDKFSQFNTGMGIFQRKRAKPDILNFVDSLGSVENRSNPMESPLNDDN